MTFTIIVVETFARAPGGSAYFGCQSPGWLADSYGLILRRDLAGELVALAIGTAVI